MIPSSSPSPEEIARLTARMLLEVKAVHFNSENPFILASGLPSPTYIDCRKLISFPRIRSSLMDFLTVTVMRNVGYEAFDSVAATAEKHKTSPRIRAYCLGVDRVAYCLKMRGIYA